ncbi:hypothetical protein MKW92_035384 [Papaver armeniacum]|nr:hypothetical protein MKW92_035384 [Papaver armeniacum]
MLAGGIIFLIGSALNGAATNVTMLILGRILLGIGVGYANQGALNMGFQLAITIGILAANLVNYGTAKIKAIIMTVGAIFLPDTPNSLLERGHQEKAKTMLQKYEETKRSKKNFKTLSRQARQQRRLNIHGGTYCSQDTGLN